MSVELPEGYEPHELPNDYTGKLFTEGQMTDYGQLRADYAAVLTSEHYKIKLRTLQATMGDLINDLERWRPHD